MIDIRCALPSSSPPAPSPQTAMATAAVVGEGGTRGRRQDWRARRRSLAGGADNNGNDGDNGDKGDAWVVVRQARCRPPPPARPPLGRRWQRRRRSAGVARGGIVKTGARGFGAQREAPTTTAMTVMKATPGSLSVWRVTVLLPPCAPPLDGNGDGGGGRRGWHKGVLSRLARAALELGLPHHQDGNDGKNDAMW